MREIRRTMREIRRTMREIRRTMREIRRTMRRNYEKPSATKRNHEKNRGKL